MYLTYNNASLANFFLALIEATCKETTQWIKHTTANDLPEAIKNALVIWENVPQWFECRQNSSPTLILVMQYDESVDVSTYTLFCIDHQQQATRVKFSTEYPGSLDMLNILARQAIVSAKTDRQETMDGSLAKETQANQGTELLDAVANFEEDD